MQKSELRTPMNREQARSRAGETRIPGAIGHRHGATPDSAAVLWKL